MYVQIHECPQFEEETKKNSELSQLIFGYFRGKKIINNILKSVDIEETNS